MMNEQEEFFYQPAPSPKELRGAWSGFLQNESREESS